MFMFVLRRLIGMTILLIGVNFLTFAYAHYGRFEQLKQNPIFAQEGKAEPFLPFYKEYIDGFINGSPIPIPMMAGVDVWDMVSLAAKNSLGLLGLAFFISLLVGLLIGISAVKVEPPRVAKWLIPVSTISLAMPGFYVGAMLITLSIYYLLYTPGTQASLPFPLGGFGWDAHLVFPVIALSFRPSIQIAQTTATLLVEEFSHTYVTVARSLGHSWRLIKYKTALRNIYVPLAQVIATSLSVMIGELILLEWLFRWPGLGRQLAASIQPPSIATVYSASIPSSYLHAPTVATVATALGAILIISNMLVSIFTFSADPRLRTHRQESDNA
jgi:ABC-type dipeptide/oligopeptide/nickel transport system permease component